MRRGARPNVRTSCSGTSGGSRLSGGAIAAPATAYQYDWNLLPIGQALWLKELESYAVYPPMQDPASYNLSQVIQQIKEQKNVSHAGE